MSHATDVLGKAVSVDLEDLRYDELSAAICALQKTMGIALMATIIKNGLLLTRRKITLEKWDDALKSMKKAIKSVPPPPKKPSPPPSPKSPPPQRLAEPKDVDESIPSPPRSPSPSSQPKQVINFFDDDYLPTELVSKIFTYLVSRSHGSFETCNERLLIISRNPSSNVSLGCHFEGRFYRSDYLENLTLCPSIQLALRRTSDEPLEQIMATTHRFRHLKRLTLCNEDSEIWRYMYSSDWWVAPIMFSLLKSCEKHVEELVITQESDWDSSPLTHVQSLHSPDISPLPNLRRLRLLLFVFSSLSLAAQNEITACKMVKVGRWD